jgi:hypothetical protein
MLLVCRVHSLVYVFSSRLLLWHSVYMLVLCAGVIFGLLRAPISLYSLSQFKVFESAFETAIIKHVKSSQLLQFKRPIFQFVIISSLFKFSGTISGESNLTTFLSSMFSFAGYIHSSDISIYSNLKVLDGSPASWSPLIKFNEKSPNFSGTAVESSLKNLHSSGVIQRLNDLS